MRIILSNSIPNNTDFMDYAFDGDWDLLSASQTSIQMRNNFTGAVTTFSGNGFVVDEANEAVNGTLTGWTTQTAQGTTVTTVTGISWDAARFITAIEGLTSGDGDSEGPFMELLSLQDVTFDASAYTGGPVSIFAHLMTSRATFIGTPWGDEFEGTSNNDTVNMGGSTLGYENDVFIGSGGSDTISFAAVTPTSPPHTGAIDLHYEGMATGITATVNGVTNTGTIRKSPTAVDTLVDVNRVLDDTTDGLSIHGNAGNDRFEVTIGSGQWINLVGGAGNNAYDITLQGGNVRLSFHESWLPATNADEWMPRGPSTGIVMDVGAGTIANNGFGGTGTITLGGDYTETGWLEIRGTNHSDSITGGAGRDSFILGAGNDTVDGGEGWDRVRFDRSQITSGVTVDLAAGTATGTWNGLAFNHTLRNIEMVRGGAFDDLLIGDSKGNYLIGHGGNDTLRGGGGNDTLQGGPGDNVFYGGSGTDVIQFYEHASTDIRALSATTTVADLQANGLTLTIGTSRQTIYLDNEFLAFSDKLMSLAEVIAQVTDLNPVTNGGTGDDLILGSDRDDWLNPGTGGRNVIDGGEGRDMLTFDGSTSAVLVELGKGIVTRDGIVSSVVNINNVTGTIFGDTLQGDEGNNLLRGGGDYDWFIGSEGSDTFDGGSGRDTAAYYNATSGIQASLAGNARGTAGLAAGDLYISVENLTGSSYADYLAGDGENNILRGLAGNDTIYGYAGRDTIDGGAGHDLIYGGADGDWLIGGAGNDTIYGGEGWDYAIFSGNRSDYQITTTDDRTVVRDLVAARDGVDTLYEVEVLVFADQRYFL